MADLELIYEQASAVSKFRESAEDWEFAECADKRCPSCHGAGVVKDDPSPFGVGLAPGMETYICDCVTDARILRYLDEQE